MDEYIERGALMKAIESITITITGMREGKTALRDALTAYRDAVLEEIAEAPAADVVEVDRVIELLEKYASKDEGEMGIIIPMPKIGEESGT